jgi:hypothetical protein
MKKLIFIGLIVLCGNAFANCQFGDANFDRCMDYYRHQDEMARAQQQQAMSLRNLEWDRQNQEQRQRVQDMREGWNTSYDQNQPTYPLTWGR